LKKKDEDIEISALECRLLERSRFLEGLLA
jgi:hypothetical protein